MPRTIKGTKTDHRMDYSPYSERKDSENKNRKVYSKEELKIIDSPNYIHADLKNDETLCDYVKPIYEDIKKIQNEINQIKEDGVSRNSIFSILDSPLERIITKKNELIGSIQFQNCSKYKCRYQIYNPDVRNPNTGKLNPRNPICNYYIYQETFKHRLHGLVYIKLSEEFKNEHFHALLGLKNPFAKKRFDTVSDTIIKKYGNLIDSEDFSKSLEEKRIVIKETQSVRSHKVIKSEKIKRLKQRTSKNNKRKQ